MLLPKTLHTVRCHYFIRIFQENSQRYWISLSMGMLNLFIRLHIFFWAISEVMTFLINSTRICKIHYVHANVSLKSQSWCNRKKRVSSQANLTSDSWFDTSAAFEVPKWKFNLILPGCTSFGWNRNDHCG